MATRYIKAKLFDFTADGHIILDGFDKEHLIIELGPNQVLNLEAALKKHIDKYKEPA